MTPENKAAFFEYAKSQMPKEACGVLIVKEGQEVLITCRNKSVFDIDFAIDPDDFAAAEMQGEVIGIVHSHVFIAARPSEADKVACEASGIEWHICSVPTGAWHSFKPSGYKAPLIGRTWAHGVLDCYALVRDYHREVLGVELANFDREFEFWNRGQDLFCPENLKIAGFIEVPLAEVRQHDGLLFQIKSKVINHAGIYLGDDLFLHHLLKRLSSRDVFAGYYRKHCVKVVRYVGA